MYVSYFFTVTPIEHFPEFLSYLLRYEKKTSQIVLGLNLEIPAINKRYYNHIYFQPGRVVTLIPSEDPSSSVWGVAYKIKSEDVEQVTSHLDYREKNGYSKKTVIFHPKDSSWQPFELTLYVAMTDNESYAGTY